MWQMTLSSPSSTEDIVCWKISGAELIPKAIWLNQNLLNGVTNVVSRRESGRVSSQYILGRFRTL